MRGRPADLGASHHQAEVLGLGMLTANLQTVSHRRRQARLITAQTFGDAALHLIVDHRIAPFICAQNSRNAASQDSSDRAAMRRDLPLE
jgi:hypothetical protein